MTEIYGIKLLDDLRFLELKGILSAHLPHNSSLKAEKFRNTADIQRKMLGELMIRAILCAKYKVPAGNIDFEYSENDKPALKSYDNIHFNISHSGDWVVCAFAEAPVGIDVEKIRKVNFGIAKRFFSEEEVKDLFSMPEHDQTDHFFDLWTIKESYLKAIGTGLTRSLSSFTVRFQPNDLHLVENENRVGVFIQSFKIDRKHKLSVCSFEDKFVPGFHQLFIDDLLGLY